MRAAAFLRGCRGKSELRRAGCRLTAGRRKATESATENRPPMAPAGGTGKGETVAVRAHRPGGNVGGRANPTRSKAKQERGAARPAMRLTSITVPGRLHEAGGDVGPREMALHPRERVTELGLFVSLPVTCALVAQLDRALASGARGHRFESCRAHDPTRTPVAACGGGFVVFSGSFGSSVPLCRTGVFM